MLSTLPGHVHMKTFRGTERHPAPPPPEPRPRGSFSPSTPASPEARKASHRLVLLSLEAAFGIRPTTQLRMSEYSVQVRQLVQIRHRRARASGSAGAGRVALTSLHIRREDPVPDGTGQSGATLLEICGSARATGRRWAFAARIERESGNRPWRMTALRLF
ncbi:Rv3235 family protein [Corynebacterium pygosceleis]|uniref:Rv3235 family protein n=1 Tax=Corynebacterium pygosceleis TaxID=2800406 RepID=A0A9Q4GI87_9CORY|nr:Rv3235 family protein [Corynebacterium pygosceleis]MCK7637710.1 Rv3235 family protein [Corynebacterium pygosceleis]MCK7674901.1 Rv3235 family protein [Corynebacterium pygosceleis]MCL0119510.1 Rv3235 family protein [Corynebacterium pygosceleis]MCX7467961.1 Rv3235 family protein [Corynebacterium pygosceleis]